jgi:hypothetical protein
MDQAYSAIALYEDLFFIKGHIKDRHENIIPNLKVVLKGESQDTVSISPDGDFCFSFLTNGNYEVTPLLDGFQFEPPFRNYYPLEKSQENQDFIAFDIVKPEVSLLYPNGGEQFQGAAFDTIKWQANDNFEIDSISIDFTFDSENNWQTLAKLKYSTINQFEWQIPDITSTNCKVRIKVMDYDGNFDMDVCDSFFSIQSTSNIQNRQTVEIPKKFEIQQNYPNPFNGLTIIRFQIPEITPVTIKIFNVMGQEIAKLIDDELDPGYHQVVWDGKNILGEFVSSGVYFYHIKTDKDFSIRKLLYVR